MNLTDIKELTILILIFCSGCCAKIDYPDVNKLAEEFCENRGGIYKMSSSPYVTGSDVKVECFLKVGEFNHLLIIISPEKF